MLCNSRGDVWKEILVGDALSCEVWEFTDYFVSSNPLPSASECLAGFFVVAQQEFVAFRQRVSCRFLRCYSAVIRCPFPSDSECLAGFSVTLLRQVRCFGCKFVVNLLNDGPTSH